jgi:hypothetical protein
MVQVRLNAFVRGERTGAITAVALPIAGIPAHHRRDVLGRNWDIEELQNGMGNVYQFRAIGEELRLAYDLASPDHSQGP